RLPRRGPRTRAARAGGAGLIRIPIRRFRLSSRATGEGSAERQISPRIESGVGMTVAPCVWTRIRMTTRRKEKGRLAPALFRFCAWSEASGAIAVPRAGASAASALGRGVRVRTALGGLAVRAVPRLARRTLAAARLLTARTTAGAAAGLVHVQPQR